MPPIKSVPSTHNGSSKANRRRRLTTTAGGYTQAWVAALFSSTTQFHIFVHMNTAMWNSWQSNHCWGKYPHGSIALESSLNFTNNVVEALLQKLRFYWPLPTQTSETSSFLAHFLFQQRILVIGNYLSNIYRHLWKSKQTSKQERLLCKQSFSSDVVHRTVPACRLC